MAVARPMPCWAPVTSATRPSAAMGGLRGEAAGEPVEDDAEALEPMAWLARARQLVVLVGEAHEHRLFTLLLEGDEQLLALLDGTAEIVLGVDDEERRVDVLGVGERRALRVLVRHLPG